VNLWRAVADCVRALVLIGCRGEREASTGALWKTTREWDAERGDFSADRFYDLSEDPLEMRDLGTEHPEYSATRAALDGLLGG